MDFFQRQDNARRKTKWLIGYFVLATLMTILAVYTVFAVFSVANFGKGSRYAVVPSPSLWNPKLFFWVTAGTLLVVVAGSLYKIAELSQGGAFVASSLGGQPLDINATTVEEKKLRNVVEEMAIASGVPVPQIYVLPEEEGINAFAAGFTTSDAVIGVTRGAMQTLTRDELQGVIGHEFSHILNGDMRMNMRLMGGINGILCIALLGDALLRMGSNSRGSGKNDSRGAIVVLGLALMVVGGIGMFFGRLIKSAISREREFLADASAVQFTRNPAGLAGALKKIGGMAQGSRLDAPNAAEASHLFFGNALADGWSNAMATHPPLEQRIRALDPGWDGTFPTVRIKREIEVRVPVKEAPMGMQPPFIPAPSLGNLIGGVPALASNQVMANMGAPTPQQVSYAGELRASIPEALRAAARQSMGACTIIYGLLVSDEESDRTKQLAEFSAANDAGLYQETVRMYPMIAALDRRIKLPLVNLCLPGLRQLSKTQYDRFVSNIQLLVESDRAIDLFEYMLQKTVVHHLEPLFAPARKTVIQFYVLKPLEEDAVVLLSALARHSSEDAAEIQRAFRGGLESMKVSTPGFALLQADRCNLSQIDVALNRIAQAAPMVKKTILHACACAVAADGVVQMQEAEMLRAIADSLDCPIPPFVQNV